MRLDDKSRKAVDLHEHADYLLTEEGLANEYAELLDRLRRGGTRDEISAMIAEKHVLAQFAELQKQRAERSQIDKLNEQLIETQKLLTKQNGGASTSFEHAPSLPHEESGDPN